METLDLGAFKSCSEIKIVTDSGIMTGQVVSWQLNQDMDFSGPRRLSLSLEISLYGNEGTFKINTEIEGPREEIITL